MQYYRCKCGLRRMFGSDTPRPCEGCDQCNTTLEQDPDHHTTPEPHQWVTKYNQNTGARKQVCRHCLVENEDFTDEETDAQEVWSVYRNEVGATSHDGSFTLPENVNELGERQQRGWRAVAKLVNTRNGESK